MIVTVSCGRHLFGRLRRLYLGFRDLMKPPLYKVKWLAADEVIRKFASHGLTLRKSFRYNFPAPGLDRLISNDKLYQAIRRRHGSVAQNKRAWLGSEYILWFSKSVLTNLESPIK